MWVLGPCYDCRQHFKSTICGKLCHNDYLEVLGVMPSPSKSNFPVLVFVAGKAVVSTEEHNRKPDLMVDVFLDTFRH